LEFNVPFQHKYGYIRDESSEVTFIQITSLIRLGIYPQYTNVTHRHTRTQPVG